MNRVRKYIGCLLLMMTVSAAAQKTLDLRTDKLKIPADGQLCTRQLQQAIDQIGKKGGGRLIFTKGTYLTGGLMLCSGVELHLEEGATL